MGKFLESIGLIDGHDIITIGKFRAKKDKIFKEIIKKDKNIQSEVKDLTEKDEGRIFAIVKKGIIKGLYLFEVEEIENNKMLNHIKTIYTKDISEDIKDKYNVIILNEAKQYVSLQEYTKVTFDDKVIQIDPKKTKKERKIALLGGFATGFLIGWITMNDIFMGIIYGIIFAPIFSGLEVVISKKRRRKKKNKETK